MLRVQDLIGDEFRQVQRLAPRDPTCPGCESKRSTGVQQVEHAQGCSWQAAQVHPPCDPARWLGVLLSEVCDTLPPDDGGQPYDENMRAAAVLGLVLVTWAARIGHAKAYDPNRPLDLRRVALDRNARLIRAVIDAAIDERQDHLYFPGQQWNPPYGPSARGGTFV